VGEGGIPGRKLASQIRGKEIIRENSEMKGKLGKNFLDI